MDTSFKSLTLSLLSLTTEQAHLLEIKRLERGGGEVLLYRPQYFLRLISIDRRYINQESPDFLLNTVCNNWFHILKIFFTE
jgi:hypothetical protein